MPDECIRIFDAQKAIEDKEKQEINVYNHLKAKATTLKGTSWTWRPRTGTSWRTSW